MLKGDPILNQIILRIDIKMLPLKLHLLHDQKMQTLIKTGTTNTKQ